MHSRLSRYLLAASLVAAPSVAAPAVESPALPPNIILIVADDLGWGDLGCYGQQKIATPNIDRLAAEGMRFTRFYAGSTVCAPSRCVLMTGLHTGHAWIRGNRRQDLRDEDVTAAELLKSVGYMNGGFGKWGLGHEGTPGQPLNQGFDTWFGYLDQAHAHNYFPSFLISDTERIPMPNVVEKEGARGQGVAVEKLSWSPQVIFDNALGFLHTNARRPFFLYFPSTIPHANNEAGRKGMEVQYYGSYEDKDWPEPQRGLGAMIESLDQQVGLILEALDGYGIADNTLVLFTSDNGPHREGGNDPDFQDSNGPLRGIKRALYEGGVRVPLLARWPGMIEPGSVTDALSSFADFVPTVCDLAGVEAPEGDGVSLLPTLLGEEDAPVNEFVYWEFYERGTAQAVCFERWKAVQKPAGTGPIEVYDLETDIGEQWDISSYVPGVVERARQVMRREHVDSSVWKLELER